MVRKMWNSKCFTLPQAFSLMLSIHIKWY